MAFNENGNRFLEVSPDHRCAIGFRLGVLYGLRRNEILHLRRDDVDFDVDAKTIRLDQSLVAVSKGAAWSDAKNERSHRRIPARSRDVANAQWTASRAGDRTPARRRGVGGQRSHHRHAAGAARAPSLL